MMSEYTEAQLRYRRSKGVAKAWDKERNLVSQGRGTRQWNISEQKELLDRGRVSHYQGHHMLSVSKYPQHADNPNNIQFLSTRKGNNEHLAAHKGDYRTPSEWRYNVNTGKTREMNTANPRAMNSYELKEKAIDKRGYRHYAANDSKNSGKKETPAQKYATRKDPGTAKTSNRSTPAKNYSSGQNKDGVKQFGRSMVKSSSKKSQNVSNTSKTGKQTAGQKR